MGLRCPAHKDHTGEVTRRTIAPIPRYSASTLGCSRLVRRNSESLSHSHQLRQRTGLHLSHHLAAADLDANLAQTEFSRDLLVQTAGGNLREHFSLAQVQAAKALLESPEDRRILTPRTVLFDPRLNGIEQIPIGERFGTEVVE